MVEENQKFKKSLFLDICEDSFIRQRYFAGVNIFDDRDRLWFGLSISKVNFRSIR